MEWLGTIASAIVLLSFTLRGERKIRSVNLIGSTFFIIYGLSISSFSICFLNSAMILIHLYYLKNATL